MEDDQVQLTDEILEQARGEAQNILSEWESSRKNRKGELEKRLAKIAAEAEERIAREKERIDGRAEARIAMERRRAELRLRDSVYRRVEETARERMGQLIGDHEYDAILEGWIVEGCVGLGAQRAVINSSSQEREIVARVLPDAVKQASRLAGSEIEVAVSEDDPIVGQGIVLVSDDGRTGYSNRVADRIRRRRGVIRRIVHERIFGDT